MKSLPLLYIDDHLAIVNKPANLLVHRTMIDRRETMFALQILRDQLGRRVYPVHRLDKAASGVLIFALDRETARSMLEVFSSGRIRKTYVAVVRGFTKETERIDHPLREEQDRMTDQRAEKDKPAQDAVTEIRRLAAVELPFPVGRYATARFSLVAARPLTGRKHQIRRHLKHIFHPIIGDTTHGDGKQNYFFRRQFDCRRLLLHAQSIEFEHPCSGGLIRVQAPLDAVLGSLLRTMGWGDMELR